VSATAKGNIAPQRASVSSVSTIVGSTGVHKYSQIGQGRGSQSKQEESRKQKREGLSSRTEHAELRDAIDGAERSVNKEAWDAGNSAAKSESREWKESNGIISGGFQTQNNSKLKS